MSSANYLTTAEILTVFTEEVAAHRGQVFDTYNDGSRLFSRSILPRIEMLRPGDKVQGGVALRATEQEVWVHPYVFRQICSNGAILAQALGTRHLDNLQLCSPIQATEFVRDAVSVCSDDEVFLNHIRGMRCAMDDVAGGEVAGQVISHISSVSRIAGPGGAALIAAIMQRFTRDRDSSRFGFANAITSVARDTRDPELRWNLEELGGGIAVGFDPDFPPDSVSQEFRVSLEVS